MEDDNLASRQRREYIGYINNSAGQLIRLIDDIVDVSIIEAEQMNLFPIAFNLNKFMEDLYVFFDKKLRISGKRHRALVLDSSGFIKDCLCFIDSARLKQILVNLIDNAFKFLDKGYICFGYRQTGYGMLEFTVEDTGVGIPENQLKIVFERFRQVEQPVNKHYGGAGLGLTISRSLIRMMGGDIHVESTEGLGSTFCFAVNYLPVAPADAHIFDRLAITRKETPGPFTGKTALVAEPVNLKYLYYEKLLTEAGFTVVRLESLSWFEYVAMNENVNLVVSGTGNTAIPAAAANPSGMPVIYIVSGDSNEYRHLTQNIPSCTLLAEPVNYDTFMNALKKILSKG
jgi:hypothetical protein